MDGNGQRARNMAANPYLRAAAVAALIAVALCIHLWPMLSKPGTPDFVGPGDAWRAFGPYAYFLDERIQHGEYPLWNPLNWCGRPFAVDITATPFYPPHLLRGLLTVDPTPMNTHTGMMIVMILHAVMAGLALYRFCRDRGLGRPASLVGAACFLFGAPFLFAVHRHYFYVLIASWGPVLLLLLHRAMDAETRRKRWRYAIALGLAFGMAMLAGGVLQPVLYIGILLVVYWAAVRLAQLRTAAAGGAPLLGGDVAVGVGAVALAIALSAVALIPTFEMAARSPRRGGAVEFASVDGGYALGELARMLAVYSARPEFQYFGTAGTITVLLALYAAVAVSIARTAPILAAAYVFLDCAIGKPMPFATLLTAAAPYELGPPERALLIGSIPLAILSAYGADALLTVRRNLGRTLAYSVGGLVVCCLLLLHLARHDYLGLPMAAAILPLAAFALMLAAPWMPQRLRQALPAAALVLLCAETLLWSSRFLPNRLTDHQRIASVEGWDTPREFWSSNRRVYDPMPNAAMYDLAGTAVGYAPLYDAAVYRLMSAPENEDRYQRQLVREAYTGNQRAQLFLKRPLWLAREAVHGPLPPKNALFPPTTTVYLPDGGTRLVPTVEAEAVPAHAVAEPSEPQRLIRRHQFDRMTAQPQTYDPLSTYYHLYDKFDNAGPHSALILHVRAQGRIRLDVTIRRYEDETPVETSYLYSYTLDSHDGETFALEYPLPDFARFQLGFNAARASETDRIEFLYADRIEDRADEDGRIRIVSRRANTIEIACSDLPGPRLLVYTDADYPGWHVEVDGAPAPLLRANDAFKAVELPAGTHTVRFVFRPMRVYAGATVSIGALVAALAAIWALRPGEDEER